MAQEYGKELKEIHMLESGNLEKQMVMEYTLGLMEIAIKVSLSSVSSMEKESKSFSMEIYITDSMHLENLLDLESIIGPMAPISKDYLKMDSGMAKEYGKREVEIVISIKETINKIKKKDMEYSHGPAEMSIRETMKRTQEMHMDKCIGLMVVTIRDSG